MSDPRDIIFEVEFAEDELPQITSLPPPRTRRQARVAVAWVLGTAVVTLALLVGIVHASAWTHRSAVRARTLMTPSQDVLAVRAEEAASFDRWQWVSQKDGVCRIPVARARELVVGAYARRADAEKGTP